MNLNAYDNINNKINKKLTWIDVNKKLLLSREIKYRKYYLLSNRYNSNTKSYDYFVILLDDIPEDRSCFKTHFDNYGRIKLLLTSIWNKSNLQYIEKDQNINIINVESADDGDIYKLDI